MDKKIFVSWTQMNKKIVVNYMDSIKEKTKIDYYLSDSNCIGNFEKWYEETIKIAPFFIAFITKESIDKKYCLNEIENAIAKYRRYNYRFITFICDISFDEINKLSPKHHIYRLINECRVSGVFVDNKSFSEIVDEISSKIEDMRKEYDLFLYKESLNVQLNQNIILGRFADISLDEFYVDREIVDENNEPIDIEKMLENNRIMIRGGAGSGKTTFIRKLALDINSHENYFFILESNEVKKILKDDLSIIEYLYHKTNCSLLSLNEFASKMKSKDVNYLAVEGLDEVIRDNKDKLLKKILVFSHEFNNFKIIFTSRHDENIDKMTTFKIKPLNKECINHAATNFINIYNKDKEKGFFIALDDIEDELKSNPLLLTQLAYIYSQKECLPTNKYDLYEMISDLIIKQTIEAALNNAIKDFIDNNRQILSECAYRLIINREEDNYSFINALNSCTNCKRPNEIYDYLVTRSIIVNDSFYHKTLLEYYASRYIFDQCYTNDFLDGFIPKNELQKLISKYDITDLYEMLMLQVDNKCQEKGIKQTIEILINNTEEYFYLLKIVTKKNVFGKALLKPLFNKVYQKLEHPYHELLYYTVKYNLYKELLLLANDTKDKYNYVYSFIQDILILYSDINISDYKDFYNVDNFIDDRTERYKHLMTYFKDGIIDYDFYYKNDEYNINVINDDKLIGHIIIKSQKSLSKQNMRYVLGLSVLDDEDFYENIRYYYNKRIITLVVPYKLNVIKELNSFKNLKRVILSNNITSIEQCAFAGCSNLTSIYISNSVASIWNLAFDECINLTNITFGKKSNLISIESQAFFCCCNLKCINLPNKIRNIGFEAFCGCSSLTTINIPSSVTSIGYDAFAGCNKLKIYCEAQSKPSGWSYEWNSSCLVYWNMSEKYQMIEKNSIEYSINNIVDDCLTAITISNNIANIGDYAFRECNKLKTYCETSLKPNEWSYEYANLQLDCWNINMSYQTIEKDDIQYLLDLINLTAIIIKYKGNSKIVKLPSILTHNNMEYAMTSIGDCAFFECNSLTKIIIPNSVTNIGDHAFYCCNNLTTICIPNSVISIGTCAFDMCENLTSINFGKKSKLMRIESSVFSFCRKIAKINIPNNVTSIGDYAFYCCNNLTTICIPNSVISIGTCAFSECSLTYIYIPKSVKVIEYGAFPEFSNLRIICETTFKPFGWNLNWNSYKLIYWNISKNHQMIKKYDIQYLLDLNKLTAIITEYKGNNKLINIPSSIIHHDKEYAITNIGDYAFSECREILSINIPNTITSIGNWTFSKCINLTSVNIPSGVISIGRRTFSDCSNLTNVIFEDNSQLINIEEYAFFGCSNLTSISIPISVTSIKQSAFSGCTILKEIKIPENFIDEIPSMFDSDSGILKQYNKKNYVIKDGYLIISADH